MEFFGTTLPDTWQTKNISEVYRYTKKPRVLALNSFDSIPFYPMDSIAIGQKRLGNPFMKAAGSLGSGTYFERGDLLLAKITPSFENGKQAIADGNYEFAYGTTEIIPIKQINGTSDIEFLFFLLLHPSLRAELAGQMEGSTGRQRLSKTILANRPIPFPPLPEQQRIAAVLSLVQRAIEQQERLIALTTELKKALMHKLFTEGTRGEPQKQTEIGPVPESWKVVELETTGNVIYGIQASVANNIEPIGTRILTNKNISLDGDFDLEKINYFELKTKRHFATILQKGDLLFNWRSGSKQHVGKTAYFDLEGEWVHSSFILRIRPKPAINGRYLFYYCNHLRESEYFIKLQTYAINAKFNKSAVNALPTVVPDREEQDQITHTLYTAQRMIDSAKNKKASLQDLFRTLLHQLMTAEIRVNDLDLEELGLDSEK